MERTQSLGALLKAAREKKGLNLEKVHQDTKMLPRLIAAMEEDAFDKIGAKAYQENFLKKYARYLGLDLDVEIACAVKDAAPYDASSIGTVLDKKPVLQEAPPRWIVPAVIMTVSIVAVAFLGVIMLRRPPTKPAAPVTKVSSEIKPISLVPKGERLRLALYARENVWVKVRSDGKVISQGVLPKGSREKLEANGRFNIWAGKLEALSFSVNGKELDIKGRGVVKDIRITHEGIELRR